MNQKLLIKSFLCSCLCWGCVNSNDAANELLWEAKSSARKAALGVESYTQAFELCRSSRENLDRILSQYPESDCALRLTSGAEKIEGATLDQLRRVEVSLGELSNACGDPLVCSDVFARKIPVKDESLWVLVADGYAKTLRFEECSKIIDSIKSPQARGDALFRLAAEYLKVDKVGFAAKLVGRMGDDSKAFELLLAISDYYIDAGNANEALLFVSRALDVAKKHEIAHERHLMLGRVAFGYARLGSLEQSFRTSELIKDEALYARSLASIAGYCGRKGLVEAEREAFSKSIKIANSIKAVPPRSYALSGISIEYAKLGKFSEAIEIADAVEYRAWSIDARINIACEYYNMGNKGDAIKIVRSIYEAALVNKNSGLLMRLADLYIAWGCGNDATNALDSAVVLVNESVDGPDKFFLLSNAAVMYGKVGANTASEKLFCRLAEMRHGGLRCMDLNGDLSVDTLSFISIGYARVGRFDKALALIENIEDDSSKVYALVGISSEYNRTGKMPSTGEKNCLNNVLRSKYPLKTLWADTF